MTSRPDTLKAVACILFAMAILPLIDVIAKYLGQKGIPAVELVWARFFFGAVCTLPFALTNSGPKAVKPQHVALNSARAISLVTGTMFFFLSLKHLPIADTLSIYFIQPIMIVMLSPLLLGEYVSLRRWLVVVLGFAGVAIIIRPGIQPFNIGHILALLAGLSSAFYIIATRKLSGRADAIVTSFQTSAIGAIALSAAAPLYWVTANGQQWFLFAALGAIAITGHYFITRAYDYGEASLLSPVNYTEMVTAVIFGWYFFSDFPDKFTFLGVAILIVCAIFVSRDRQVKQAA